MMKTRKEIHRPDLKGKFYEDREILHAVEFEPAEEFEAISAAQVYLGELGYTIASMCGDEPIGFALGCSGIAKWRNLSATDKMQLDGIITPNFDFREGGVIILFFNPPKY